MTSRPLRSEADLLAACLALGADGSGGSLSSAERQLVAAAGGDRTGRVPSLRQALRAGEDPLGDAFCALRPSEERRRSGAFYTDRSIVDAMVAWVLAHEPDEVIDAGCGSGRFTLACRAAGYDGEIIAIDSDPLATLIARANLAAAGFPATVLHGDFLKAPLPPPKGRRAFLGNPPYVRHHDLDPAAKRWAKQAGDELGLAVSGLAGLHALFILRAALASRDGDLGCFVTSAEWLDVGYGRLIRRLLAGRLGCVRLDFIDPRAVAFSDAMSTALIASWQVGHRGSVKLRRVASREALGRLEGGLARGRAELDPEKKWTPLFGRRRNGNGNGLVPLSTYARVHRGVVTGANDFFVMNYNDARERGLAELTRPCIHRARQVVDAHGVIREGACPMRLLDASDWHVDDPSLRRYVAEGERRGLHQRYVCSHRRPWWRVGGTPPPRIVATYMARRPPAFALNPDDCQILNVFHGIHFLDEIDEGVARQLVAWLNRNASTFEGGRVYHGGLRKFEPGELEAILVPPLAELPKLEGR